jgi:hypothetical protein
MRQISSSAQSNVLAATVHAYTLWLEERDAVRDSYERWAARSSWSSALAFGAFLDALDREERAAYVYETVLRESATDRRAAGPVVRRRRRASTKKP